MILQHAPARVYFEGWEALGLKIPLIEKYFQLIELYDSKVIGICLNIGPDDHSPALDMTEVERYKKQYSNHFDVTTINPLVDDLQPIIEQICLLL